jgi:hypothetical protein
MPARRYLTSANYDFSYDRSKNLRPKRNIRTAMNLEIMLYGIAQALESTIHTTRPAHVPTRLPFPSHARVVPCLGFVLSLCRRSSLASTRRSRSAVQPRHSNQVLTATH